MLELPVLIVGAGPAGCACSIFLSKKGIAHAIVDKAAFPRDKVCGDAVSGKSLYVIRAASDAWQAELMEHADTNLLPSSGLSFIAPSGEELAIPLGTTAAGHTLGFTATRLFFDNFLFQKLDKEQAKIFTNATLSDLQRKGDTWAATLQTAEGPVQINARLLIGADGDKSIVRKKLGLSDAAPKATAIGLRAYYSGIKGLEHNRIELHFLPEMLPSYFWIFPLPGGRANVGAGMMSEDVRDKKLNLRESMLHAIKTNPALAARFADARLEGKILGWGLPMGMSRAPLSGDGYLLTGDAAQLIDPFSGEGIGNALYSGMKAAAAIEAALSAGDVSASFLKAQYDTPVYSRLWPELRISALLQRLCRYPAIFNFIIRKANRSPTLKTTLTGMFTDVDLRKKLREPSFYLKMLLNR